jgi:TatA/E family protein of Tat protein translocase
VAALLLFGPRRLPELGRTLGKGLAEFRRASAELRRTLDAEGLEQDLRETRETIRSVDPRRYVKEALMSDQAEGRVARGSQAAPAASDPESAPDDDARVRDPIADEASADDPAVSDSSIDEAANLEP